MTFIDNKSLPKDATEYESLIELACDRAVSLGLCTRSNEDAKNPWKFQPAGVTLIPSPLPRWAFQKAIYLEPFFHNLFCKIVNDDPNFIINTLENVQDDLAQKLIQIYKDIQNEQFGQIGRLQIYRNDYMVEEDGIKQIEYNCIASSLQTMAEKIKMIHKTIKFNLKNENSSEFNYLDSEHENKPLTNQVNSIKIAYDAYKSATNSQNPAILIVIDKVNFNKIDIENFGFKLEALNISTIFKTFEQLTDNLTINEQGKLHFQNREIAIVYFRFGYNFEHYTTEKCFEIRKLIELSVAIKCPSIEYQLLGFKAVQVALSKPNILKQFINDQNQLNNITSVFAKQYNAGDNNALSNALKTPSKFVLKEQSEGGSEILMDENLIQKCKLLLDKSTEEQNKWVVMERIYPTTFKTLTTRQVNSKNVQPFTAISELGIYSTTVEINKNFKLASKQKADMTLINSQINGYLLRTKGANVASGGVATGVASIDDFYFT